MANSLVVRRLIFWLGLVLAVVAVRQLMATGDRETITYSEFVAQLDAGNIQRVRVTGDRNAIEGDFRREAEIAGHTIHRFYVDLPSSDLSSLIGRLEAGK